MTNPRSFTRAAGVREMVPARSESASVALDGLVRGGEVFCLTFGQFSFIDAIWALLRKTGPADVSIATWTAAGADTTPAEQFLADGRIRSIRWLVDRSFETRQPAYCATLRRLFGDDVIRTTRSHAKFATIRNDDWALAVRTSMNLNMNPRLETIEVSDSPPFADFLDGMFDEVFAGQPPGVMKGELPPVRPLAGIEAGRGGA